jgi:hypothetical protein
MVRKISKNEWEFQAREILLNICTTDNPSPWEPCFTENEALSERIVLYEFGFSFFDSKFKDEYFDAFRAVGEKGFYVVITETDPNHPEFFDNKHCYPRYYSLNDEDDLGREIILENIAYSENGSWGMLFSHWEHAILTCTPAIMRELEKRIPNLHDQLFENLEYYKYLESKWNWFPHFLKPLLFHIYGEKKGSELFEFYENMNP